MFEWFASQDSLGAWLAGMGASIRRDEERLYGVDYADGYCKWCNARVAFKVAGSAWFGDLPNLREGMICPKCRLTSRQRLVGCAIVEAADVNASVVLLEHTTRLSNALTRRYKHIVTSEFLGEKREGGRHYFWRSSKFRPRFCRHEDITKLSFRSGSVDLIAHSDVLEHVFAYRQALSECARVLRPGGTLLFTAPFFHDRAQTTLRGRPNPDGSITHFEAPEYHGGGLDGRGVYTYHTFGWDLTQSLKGVGFSEAKIGIAYSPENGWASMPIIVRAIKG